MGIKEEVLKELEKNDRYDEFLQGIAIDLTLKKVADEIDRDIKYQDKNLKGDVELDKAIIWRMIGMGFLKGRLGVEE